MLKSQNRDHVEMEESKIGLKVGWDLFRKKKKKQVDQHGGHV